MSCKCLCMPGKCMKSAKTLCQWMQGKCLKDCLFFFCFFLVARKITVASYPGICLKIFEPGHKKTCLMSYANNKGADQPAHPRSLISAFVFRCLDSLMSLVSVTKISSLMLPSVAEQASLSLTWSETPEDTFFFFSWRCSFNWNVNAMWMWVATSLLAVNAKYT